MRPHLPLLLTLSVAALYACACAESVSVSSWDDISAALTAGNQEMIMGGDITAGWSNPLTAGSATVIDGNGHSFVMGPQAEGQTNITLITVGAGSSLVWKNVSVTGSMGQVLSLSARNTTSGELVVDGCSFSDMSGEGSAAINVRQGKKFSLKNSVFSNNGGSVVAVLAGVSVLESGEIDNCTFTGNGTANKISSLGGGGAVTVTMNKGGDFIIKNSTFTSNHLNVGENVVSRTSAAGAIQASDYLNIQDCSFIGNYTQGQAKDVNSQGGAIHLSSTDSSSRSMYFILSTLNKDSVFQGNRTGASVVDGKPVGGRANAIYLDLNYNSTISFELSTFSIKANKDTSISFYDPVVITGAVNATNISRGVGVISFNARESGDVATMGQGTILFSGKDHDNDADRMSRINAECFMRQDNGNVIVTEKAILGANVTSTTLAEAKAGDIKNIGYNLGKGTLSITKEGSLIAGGFMVGRNSGVANEGWSNCVLSVGSGASLTTGWVDMEQGVSFDLLSFYQGNEMGLFIDFTDKYQVLDPRATDYQYGYFVPSEAGRFVLGGTLGLADSLDMYRNEMWKTDQEFLLLNLSKSAADAYTASGSTNFDEIISNTSGKSNVEDESVYTGKWTQKWVDDAEGGKKLYAVWEADGNTPMIPEPSSAMLAMLGLGVLLNRRGRK